MACLYRVGMTSVSHRCEFPFNADEQLWFGQIAVGPNPWRDDLRLTPASSALRDKTDIRFLSFVHAPSFCGCSRPTAVLQRVSPNRTSTGAKMTQTETALLQQPGLTIEPRDWPGLEFVYLDDVALLRVCGIAVAAL